MPYDNLSVEAQKGAPCCLMSKGRIGLIVAGVVICLAVIIGLAVGIPLARSKDPLIHARQILEETPLVDGHNDLPYRYFIDADNKVEDVDLTKRPNFNISHTDIPRLKHGRLGAQFWVAYVDCSTQHKDAVRATLEQIDVIKRFIKLYPQTFEYVTTSQGIKDAFGRGKIASLIAVEGGHSIDSSLSTLRMMYELGARYMTLTHNCNEPWADNSKVDSGTGDPIEQFPGVGISDFGKVVVKEMNRLGMMVDLSHVSHAVMSTVSQISEAPVIFSHSSAWTLCNHPRNVKDDVLKLMPSNGGVVMINFFNLFVSCPPLGIGNITNKAFDANLTMVADHVDYVKKVAGVDHVGIGADYDGVPWTPKGLEDVSTYPDLFAELIRRGWTDEDLKKLAGENLLRVFKRVEEVRDQKLHENPFSDVIPVEAVKNFTCRTRLPKITT